MTYISNVVMLITEITTKVNFVIASVQKWFTKKSVGTTFVDNCTIYNFRPRYFDRKTNGFAETLKKKKPISRTLTLNKIVRKHGIDGDISQFHYKIVSLTSMRIFSYLGIYPYIYSEIDWTTRGRPDINEAIGGRRSEPSGRLRRG